MPTVEILMDVSDEGLCVLFPSQKQFIRVRYSTEELEKLAIFKSSVTSEFGINLCELMSAVFAALMWGLLWASEPGSPVNHACFRIDNTSAIAWNNKRSSHNPFAQILLRTLSLVEVAHNFFATVSHITGVENVMTDAGSRVWKSQTHADQFANLSLD